VNLIGSLGNARPGLLTMQDLTMSYGAGASAR
jgi:hypothetical protein